MAKKEKKEAKVKEPKEKIVKVRYVQTDEAAGILDGDGHLIEAPVNFDPKRHKAPGKKDFASEDVYLEWAAIRVEKRGHSLIERASRMREAADTYRQYGDPAQRKLMKRREKLLAQLAAVDSALEEEGIEGDE